MLFMDNEKKKYYNESTKKAILKYQKSMAKVQITVKPEVKQAWQKKAADYNLSLTQLVKNAVESYEGEK